MLSSPAPASQACFGPGHQFELLHAAGSVLPCRAVERLVACNVGLAHLLTAKRAIKSGLNSPLVVHQRAFALRLCVQHVAVLHRQRGVSAPSPLHTLSRGTGH